MPYALESPLASAAGALGGYLEGVQSKKDKAQQLARQQQLDQQSQADTAARLGLERSNQEATNAYRRDESLDRKARLNLDTQSQARADAAAAETAKRQKIIDTFQGQGLHYPKGWETMKPEAKIGYLQVRLNKAQQAGDTKTVTSTEGEINKVATEAEQARRDARQTKVDQERDRHDAALEAASNRRIDLRVNTPGAPKVPRNKEGLTPEEVIQNAHWDAEHKNPKTKALSIPAQRSADADAAGAAIAKGGDRDKIVKHYAAKWGISTDKASDELPDQ